MAAAWVLLAACGGNEATVSPAAGGGTVQRDGPREPELAITGALPARASPAGPVVSASTRHLDLVATLSHDTVAPGRTVSVRLDVTPRPGMHVYAPGATYQAIEIRIDPDPVLRVHAPVYPTSIVYVFEPLDERVPVYSAPFRITQDATVAPTSAQRARLRRLTSLTIRGEVEYQACDDTKCYLPTTVPLEWTVGVEGAPNR